MIKKFVFDPEYSFKNFTNMEKRSTFKILKSDDNFVYWMSSQIWKKNFTISFD